MDSIAISSNAEVRRAIQIAQSIAKEYQNEFIYPAHLLRALLHSEFEITKFLESIDKDVHYLREWADVRIETLPKASRAVSEPSSDDRTNAVIEEADNVRIKFGKDEISPIHLLAALTMSNVAFTREQLKTLPLNSEEILEGSLENIQVDELVSSIGNTSAKPTKGNSALLKYCIDKTALAKEGKIDPIIGRDKETRMMIEILGRRTKPNVLIVGEPGVGKTALVDGFALSIADDTVPANISGAFLFELDTGALVAGASYKGEVEDRLKSIIKEIKKFDRAILFIDEIHLLLDSTGPIGSGAVNLLKPELARGEITLIGATTSEEYRELIEPEQAFNRRFELLRVDEPDKTAAERMLKKLVPFYESHHQLKVDEDAPAEAVYLAKRYIKDRRLPDAAIDLVDRTMAAMRLADETSKDELEKLKNRLEEIKEAGISLAELDWFHRELENKISPILLGQLESEDEEFLEYGPYLNYIESKIQQLAELAENKKGAITKTDIAAVVSHTTGIPIGKIQKNEQEKLMQMEDILKQRVIGQDLAIKSITDAILESRSGLKKAGQPIGSFFFLGPTGTGKTELAKSLAEFLFNDESAMIRFDMSEFKEEHSAALLYGAPPGYVGYKEGGLLVNKIREKPYSVLLFDEVEKAHPSVFDVFLQILDEGKLHDRLGKEGDFSNAVVLFTSNIGSEVIIERHSEKNELPESGEMMEIMSGYFRPEFLARVTEIVPFAPITQENVVKIFKIHLNKLLNTLERQGITLNLTDEVITYLATKDFTPKYGARPLVGVIRNELRRPISKMIVSGKLLPGNTIDVDMESEELQWAINTE